ncbi:MAG: PQQ-binding-like beta-propeller repeat protein [Mariniblastus sp.]
MIKKQSKLIAFFRFIPLLVCAVCSLIQECHADWPQFRGLNSAGIGSGLPPVEFSADQNRLWKVDVGAGHSSPCIVGPHLFVTSYDEPKKTLEVICLEKTSGKLVWKNEIQVKQFEKGHPSFNPASSTPTSDGERVVAYFGSYGLVCYDVTGKLVWEIKMPVTKSFGGNATSPAIVGDRVILYRGNYVDHFLLAVNKRTGEEDWRVAQEEEFTGEMACTACPIVAGDQVIIHSARSIQAYQLKNGSKAWEMKCATTGTSTPVLVGEEVLVAAWNKMGEPSLRPEFPSFDKLLVEHDRNDDGFINRGEFPELWIFHRPEGMEAPMNGAKIRFDRADQNKDSKLSANEWSRQLKGIEKFRENYQTHGILAIPLKSEGMLGVDQIRTLETQGISEVPSPVSDGKYLYFVKNGGVLSGLEIATGKRVYRKRTGGKGTHYASPLIAGDRIYCTAGDGKISVISTGANPEVLAINDLKEDVFATPAIVDGVIYVRTHSALFAFGEEVER